MQKARRSIEIYIAAILALFAAAFDTYIGVLEHWPNYVFAVVWVGVLLILYTALDVRIPLSVQSILFSVLIFNSVFLTGLYIARYHVVFLLFTGSIILTSFYHQKWLVMFQLFLALVGLALHGLVFKVVILYSDSSVATYVFQIFLVLGIGITTFLDIMRDDKARKHLEDTAHRAEKAEKSKSDFLANMSHEIRTPMNAIIGMCELALREKNLSESIRGFCNQIQNSGRSLLNIINDILDFSKIESGMMELVEDEFNLASTLNDVINMTMTRMGDKHLEFVVRVDTDIPKGLIGDEIRIKQVMINLLTNAVKYTPDGGITLRVSKTIRKYGINLKVSVEDSGIGIKQENIEKLFNSFQQVDAKKNRAVEGTGLGLVITKRLVTNMGGFINVKSEYGKGSTFSFVIPLKVSDRTPFVSVEEAEKVHAACYIDVDKFKAPATRLQYKKFLAEIGDSLQVRNFLCNRFEDLESRVNRGNLTHCFIGREEYLNNKEYFEKLAEKMQVVIVQNRRGAVDVPANIKCIYKPIYEVPLASVFNNETLVAQRSNTSMTVSFVAPKARVLIVDDNAINLQVASGLMQPYKMQVSTVESGEMALKAVENKGFDIIFMDHMMPGMDGMEATKLIREMDGDYFKNVPIIALTANAVGGARESFLANGFDGFLAKPIELSALDRVLKQFVPKTLQERRVSESKVEEDSKRIYTNDDIKKYVDEETGLFYTGGSIDAYLNIMKSYVEKGESKIAQIKKHFEDRDWKNYVIEVHALKSSSLSLGAKDLSEMAKKLELAGKSDDIDCIMQDNDKLLDNYYKVLERAKKLIGLNSGDNKKKNEKRFADEKGSKKSIDKTELRSLIFAMREYVASFDSDVLASKSKELMGYTYNGDDLESIGGLLYEAANDFEYDKIGDLLNGLAIKYEVED